MVSSASEKPVSQGENAAGEMLCTFPGGSFISAGYECQMEGDYLVNYELRYMNGATETTKHEVARYDLARVKLQPTAKPAPTYKEVPIEPSMGMLSAGIRQLGCWDMHTPAAIKLVRNIWVAMLNEAPPPL